jgi:hypothetical protein
MTCGMTCPVSPAVSGTAITSFQAAGTGDSHISAGPGADTREMVAIGGDVLWAAVPRIAVAGLLVTNGA